MEAKKAKGERAGVGGDEGEDVGDGGVGDPMGGGAEALALGADVGREDL